MKLKYPFQDSSLRSLVMSIGIVLGIVFFTAIFYFYVYLPHVTNHGDTITVPDIQGKSMNEVPEYLEQHELRFIVSDSSYSEKYPPLAVLKQFPKAGSKVKQGRTLYLSVNRITPPTLPLPDLTENFSLTGAELIIRSNELRRGKVFYKPDPFMNIVLEMRYQGKHIEPNTRVPKGAIIDLVVGDGQGSANFKVGNLVGDDYGTALFKLEGWNLHLGNVEKPADADTTGVEVFVFKQYPAAGDSVRVGAPVDLWIGPKGYKPASDENQ